MSCVVALQLAALRIVGGLCAPFCVELLEHSALSSCVAASVIPPPRAWPLRAASCDPGGETKETDWENGRDVDDANGIQLFLPINQHQPLRRLAAVTSRRWTTSPTTSSRGRERGQQLPRRPRTQSTLASQASAHCQGMTISITRRYHLRPLAREQRHKIGRAHV